jgi:ATP-dependent DNA helicase PIF1
MAIVRKFGKPDLFITMTCNPKWQEIRRELLPGQQASDRPDLTARIFRGKLKSLMRDIMENHIFGNCFILIIRISSS